MAEWTQGQIDTVYQKSIENNMLLTDIYSALMMLDMDTLNNRLGSILNTTKFLFHYNTQFHLQQFYRLLVLLDLSGKSYSEDIPLYKLTMEYNLNNIWAFDLSTTTCYSEITEVTSNSSGITIVTNDIGYSDVNEPMSYYIHYKVELTFEKKYGISADTVQDDISSSLSSLVAWFNTQFNLDDLVKGEPYSLPPANTELVTQSILAGITSSVVSQVVPIGTFAMQLLEQYQMQKLNYVQDVQFQLIIALFKTIVGGQWPKGDLSEIFASIGSLDSGLEYRAKVNDVWLNQSLTRALNHFPSSLDTPSVDKVVAEKTDTFGVVGGDFRKIFPFQIFGAPFVSYLSVDMELMIHSYYQGRW